MPQLTISSGQAASLEVLDPHLDAALAAGVQTDSGSYQPLLPGYSTLLAPVKVTVKGVFRMIVASFMKAINLHNPFPVGLSTTVALAKVTPGGTNGSITYVDGFVIVFDPPT